MANKLVKGIEPKVEPTKGGIPGWRTALALTLSVALFAAAAAAAVTTASILGEGEPAGASTSGTTFLALRRLQPASHNATGAVAGGDRQGVAGDSQEMPCLTAMEGEVCHRLVQWAMEDGLRLHPEKYTGLTRSSSFEDFQLAVHRSNPEYCPRPCTRRQPPPAAAATPPAAPPQQQRQQAIARPNASSEALGGCDYGHTKEQQPAHAGCFIVRGGKMLAIRLTYDGNRYDIPGGQTNWHEPARCTAHREALEETGYWAAPRDLLAVVRNGFHVYRCHLVEPDPVRGHDHEVSWVGWLSRDEVAATLQEGNWRFPEAQRYLDWMQ